ncbi:unnamed protein product, partial [Polarella glacialis]
MPDLEELGDAAPSSGAHAAVKWRECGSRYDFRLKAADGSPLSLQVAISKTNGCHETAARIARLCYEKIEQGMSKDEVMTFRNSLQASVANKPAKPKAASSAAAPKEAAAAPAAALVAPSPAAQATPLPDALKQQEQDPMARAIAAASAAAAAAVAAAVAVQESQRQSPPKQPEIQQQTQQQQQASYQQQPLQHPPQQLQQTVPSEAREPARKTKKKTVVRIAGRDNARPSATINGVFSVRKTLFHGRKCFERLGECMVDNRFLFYSSPLFQWKISDRLDDAAPVFAFALSNDRGTSLPTGPEIEWMVFDGADSYSHDPEVQLLEEVIEVEEDETAHQDKKRKKKKGDAEAEPDLLLLKRTKLEEMAAAAWQLEQEGKLQTALMIDGRDLSRKNHLINGVYVARAGNFHGARSYEKIGNSGKRFLFYSATKQGWKISDKLQDLQSFAYARVE